MTLKCSDIFICQCLQVPGGGQDSRESGPRAGWDEGTYLRSLRTWDCYHRPPGPAGWSGAAFPLGPCCLPAHGLDKDRVSVRGRSQCPAHPFAPPPLTAHPDALSPSMAPRCRCAHLFPWHSKSSLRDGRNAGCLKGCPGGKQGMLNTHFWPFSLCFPPSLSQQYRHKSFSLWSWLKHRLVTPRSGC